MATPPDFTPGAVLTASQMDAIGLWLVDSGTLSVTTTYQNVVGCFDNADFANYRILLDVTAVTTSSRLEFRFLDNTTQAQTAYFNGGVGGNYASDTTVYMQRSNNDTRLFLGAASVGLRHVAMDIFHPDQALVTTYTGQFFDQGPGLGYAFGGVHATASAYDGFALGGTAGTMTVQYAVYGYRN